MDFKTDRVKKEWAQLLAGEITSTGARLLVPVALYVDAVSLQVASKPALVTMIWREPAEQLELTDLRNGQLAAAGKPIVAIGTRSVHEFWRGVDFRSWIYTPKQADEICRLVNLAFRYDGRRQVLALHKYGSAAHLHGQVPNANQWRV